MRKEDKNQLIATLTEELKNQNYLYITDISGLNVAKTNELRRLCFRKDVKLIVVKNTLLRKAMENSGKDYGDMYTVLKGQSAIMFAEQANTPAQLIKEFRRSSDRPLIKGAFVEEVTYIGDHELDNLVALKSKNELIADVIALLQSPVKNVISALQSGGQTIAGVLKTLSERPE
ncbi:MAG: 50S ribosomal protein L10 [Lentimicrobiaceae bacterium]|nr:50S ribosomal protein L10 [Lentimicrobiaceae bacterium]